MQLPSVSPSATAVLTRTVLGLVLRRASGHRRLLAAVIIGVVLAVGLMSATEIYRNALRELGVDVDLSRADKVELDLSVSSSTHPFAPAPYAQRQELVDERLDRVGQYLSGRAQRTISSTFFLTDLDLPRTDDPARPRSNLQFFTDLAQHISIDAGRFPTAEAGATPAGGVLIEVAIGSETARRHGVALGDRFDLHPFWREDVPPVRVQVVGLISPRDASAEYWGRRSDQFLLDTQNWPSYLFFTTQETLIEVLPRHIADLDGRIDDLAFFDLETIDAADAEPLAHRLRVLERAVGASVDRTHVTTEMPDTLAAFSQKEFFAQVPLLVLTLQIVAIVLYYLVMVAALLVDRQAGEVALLKSRGAGAKHILGIYGVEGFLLAALGFGLGPPLALGAVALLGLTPAFDGLSGGALLDVRLTTTVYAWAGLGAVLAFFALLIPAIRAGRRSIVQYKQSLSRPETESAFHRYYLDLVIVVVAALLFFQLQHSDSLVTEELFGDINYDPLLLLAPAVFLVTVAVVFLRLFPLLLRATDALTARFSGTAVQLGIWQLMRAPLGHSRLVLLLLLATAIGMFAATFGSTLDRSFDDRAAYLAGAPLRLADVNKEEQLGPQALTAQFEARDDVEAAAAVLRTNVRSAGGRNALEAELLGVDPSRIPDIAWFRDDLADGSLATLVAPLTGNTGAVPGIAVPAEARRIGIWSQISRSERAIVFLRILDAGGRYQDMRMQDVLRQDAGWQMVSASLDGLPAGEKFVTAILVRRAGRAGAFAGQALWDDLQYSPTPGRLGEPFEDGVVIEDFAAVDHWEPVLEINTRGRFERFSTEREDVISVPSAARYIWDRGFSSAARGIRVGGDGTPLSVLANAAFLAEADLEIGDEIRPYASNGTIPMRIVGAFELFPTHDPRSGKGVLIADIGRLSYFMNRHGSRSGNVTPNEVWITPSGDAGLASLREAIAEGDFGEPTVFDTAALREAQDQDPLTAAGWDGLLLLSFIAVLLLSALGVLVSSLAAARTRALEFAILRTMGFSMRQILAVVSFEQIFIVVLAMAAGTLVGSRLGILMLEFLGVTERGEEVVPPFVLVTDWSTISVAYGILGLVFLLAIGVVVALHAHLALYRVLRLGE